MRWGKPLTIERLTVYILFILLFVMAVRVPTDTDTWWHLRSGEDIVEQGEIPRQDSYSHTRQGADWIDHSWAAQVILYGVYKLTGGQGNPADSGIIGLALLTALLATAGMGLVYRMGEGTVYSRMFVLVLGTVTAAVFWTARPQMFSFFFGAVILYLLYLLKYRRIDRLWIIPPLMVVWVNLHGGFAIGFIFLLLFLIGETVGKLLGADDKFALDRPTLQKLALLTGISIPLLSLNPYGPEMVLYPFRTAGLQTLNLFIQEWKSPDFKEPLTWPFVFMLMSLLFFAGRNAQKIPFSDLALVIGTTLLALWAARNLAVFAVATTPVLSRQSEVWLRERGWQIKPMQNISPRMARLNWILLVVVIIGAIAQMANTLHSETVKEAHKAVLPVQAVEILQSQKPTGPIFNDYNWGGYFIFVLRDYPVFVDGRTDLYDDDFLEAYFRTLLGAEEWQEPLEKYDIRLVIVTPTSAIATLLRETPEAWAILYEEKRDKDEALPLIIFQRIDQP